MSVIEYLVTAKGVIERGAFYNYMHEHGYSDDYYTKEQMINSTYPFAICMKEKKLMIMESATMCYLNDKAGHVISVEEFKSIMEDK